MSSAEEIPSSSPLPPVICNNPREKIAPEQVDLSSLILPQKTHKETPEHKQTVACPNSEAPQPCPQHPLTLVWSPHVLYFELEEEPITCKLQIWNGCSRTIYIHCCGLWSDTARLGAGWRTYPRTRFHLAPGLKSEVFVRATPRLQSPVPCALLSLQLAASHMRDNVTGYFCVPIVAKFLSVKTYPLKSRRKCCDRTREGGRRVAGWEYIRDSSPFRRIHFRPSGSLSVRYSFT